MVEFGTSSALRGWVRVSSRVNKRQTAPSTGKGLGNFLALEPWQFYSDFSFESNHIGVRCYYILSQTIRKVFLKDSRVTKRQTASFPGKGLGNFVALEP